MPQEPYQRMLDAAWAAFAREPDPDGIRRVRLVPQGAYTNPYFCLDERGHWFLEERRGDEVDPNLTTEPRPCPPAWIPPDWREDREEDG
jgi:hypothetical protein